jgi:hypothetical protein
MLETATEHNTETSPPRTEWVHKVTATAAVLIFAAIVGVALLGFAMLRAVGDAAGTSSSDVGRSVQQGRCLAYYQFVITGHLDGLSPAAIQALVDRSATNGHAVDTASGCATVPELLKLADK